MKLILILIFMFSNLIALQGKTIEKKIENKQLEFKYDDYDSAKNSNNYLIFKGSSTKFKVFTTEFDGVAKDFKLTYKQSNNVLNQIVLTIKSKEIDTDNGSRNQKMYDKCLKTDTYPDITVTTEDVLELKEAAAGELNIKLKIKDKSMDRKLKYSIASSGNGESYIVVFDTNFSFIEAGIEDPSIAIAKVAEIFTINGKIEIKKVESGKI